MGKAFREQAFSRKASIAINKNDEAFLFGMFFGAMVALKHYCLNPDNELHRLGLMTGIAAAKKIAPDVPTQIPQSIEEVIESSELHTLFITAFSELHTESLETRTRFLEGMIEGNDLELFIKDAAMRAGSAYWVEFMMLLFWPEIEAMKTRREAFNFVQFCLKITHLNLTNEVAFIKLARHYQFKSKK